MTNSPLLSICIPTYNRQEFLRECLASIQLDDVRDLVEIVVSDNASTDRTVAVLETFRTQLPIRWVVQESNLGADRNFDAVVSEARGEYCWLLGSDDVVTPDAVTTIIDLLRLSKTDILQFGYIQGDIQLRQLRREFPESGRIESTTAGLAQHLGKLPNLSLLFTFISAFIFRRTAWIKRRQKILSWVDSYYIQTAAMHGALVDGASLTAVGECFVIARGNNPNEFNTIPGRFIALDAKTMARLIKEIYGDSVSIQEAIGNTFRRSYTRRALLYAATYGGMNYIVEVDTILKKLGYSPIFLKSLKLASQLKLLIILKSGVTLRRAILAKLNSKA